MIDHPGFLQDILVHPEDDTPRLVYADWLDENAGTVICTNDSCGNPAPGWNTFYPCRVCRGTGRVSDGRAERAEFIRVQCELARIPECQWCGLPTCRYIALRRRERELWWSFYPRPVLADWLKPVPGLETEIGNSAGTTPFTRAMTGDNLLGLYCGWRRGFVEAVTCTAADWLEYGEAVLACQPVTRVDLGRGRVRERGPMTPLEFTHILCYDAARMVRGTPTLSEAVR